MLKRFFDSNNIIWRTFNKFSDLMMLSLCWLLCCIGVVTIGASSIALYDAVSRCVRGDEGNMFRRFFRTFKNELGRGILLTVLWGLLCAALYIGYLYLYQAGVTSTGYAMISILYFFALFLPLAVLCWVISIESRFAYSFGQLHRTAFIFAFGYLPKTIPVVALLAAAIIVLLNLPFLVFIIPGLMTYFQSHFIEKVFVKYMPSE